MKCSIKSLTRLISNSSFIIMSTIFRNLNWSSRPIKLRIIFSRAIVHWSNLWNINILVVIFSPVPVTHPPRSFIFSSMYLVLGITMVQHDVIVTSSNSYYWTFMKSRKTRWNTNEHNMTHKCLNELHIVLHNWRMIIAFHPGRWSKRYRYKINRVLFRWLRLI